MATIIDSLILEHGVFNSLFDAIKRLLPGLKTVDEVRLLGRVVESVLTHHADAEQNLAYAALDHALAEKGQLDRLYQDHEEIDARFHQVQTATSLGEAVKLLKAAIRSSQDHFRREERCVFPLFERLLGPAALEALGNTAVRRSITGMPTIPAGIPLPASAFPVGDWKAPAVP